MVAAGGPWGCSDSAAPEVRLATIRGTVTTVGGDPVAGAAVLVSFRPSLPEVQPTRLAPPSRTIPRGAVLRFGVTDACGEPVRTVCDGDCDSLATFAFWDGRDDEGLKVLDGVYTVWIVVKRDSLVGEETFSRPLLLVADYDHWDPALYEEPHGRSNAAGEYEFNDACLGFGDVFTITGADQISRDYPVSRWIDLLAVHPDGRRAWVDSVWVPEEGEVEVGFLLETEE